MLAVSGLHIGLIGWLVFSLSKGLLSFSYRLALKTDIRKIAAIITCFPVVAYTCFAGFEVSSQRAMVMGLAFLGSIVLGRERDVWSTLTLAALIVLALDPHAPFSISFQLSFCAVIGILWLGPAIYGKIPGCGNGDFRQKHILSGVYVYFGGLFAITLSATIFLLPVTSYYFHRISMVAIPANLIALPVLGVWILPLGFLAVICLPFSPFLSNIFLSLGAWGLDFMMGMIQFWADLPCAAFWVITPNILEIILFYGLVFCTFFVRRWKWAKLGILCLLSVMILDTLYWTYGSRFNPHLRVTYLDVGQGNSALIQFPGKERMLIDGGGFPRDHFDVGRMVVAPFLFKSKIRRIDYLVLSHPQADHMNGLRFIAANFNPKEFWCNGDRVEGRSFTELMRTLDSRNIKKLFPADLRGGREISGVKIELLHPLHNRKMAAQSYDQAMKLNDNSLVLKLSYGGKSLLFPGDLERSGEEVVVSNVNSLLSSDILLVPHHGSEGSCSEPFLQMVSPQLCIISSGSGNYFGFPHRETPRRLKAVGCTTLRVDEVGAVQLWIGPNRFEVRTFLRP
jgi:competence protein ComEC